MRLLDRYPGQTLICLTVIMPGSVKRNFQSLIIGGAAVKELINSLGEKLVFTEVNDAPTGYEAYFIADVEPRMAKDITCRIEDTHPLGRLFDLDVILPGGEPMGRTTIGSQPRKCLLCENEARFCMRNHTHSPAQLQHKIDQMVEQYVQ